MVSHGKIESKPIRGESLGPDARIFASSPTSSVDTDPRMFENRCTVSVLIPYFNEAGYIGRTLNSLLSQSRKPDEIILVDNASTDGSEGVCRTVLEAHGFSRAVYLREPIPGKTHALETGLRHVTGDFVATCDADMYYPEHYLDLALRLFQKAPPGTAAVMAQYVETLPDQSNAVREKLRENVRLSRIFKGKCFTGGGGQIFRTATLLKVGGFSAKFWNCVLLDHEVINRLRKSGSSLYHEDMWCLHTDRRKDRSSVRWTLWDRLLYRYTPEFLGDWYFYDYLGPRLLRKKMTQLNLRVQPWSGKTASPA